MPDFQPKRSCRSLSTISSLDSQIRRRASTYNESERSVNSSGSKLCESRRKSRHHVLQIPRPLPPLPAKYTTRAVPPRHSPRVTNQTLPTREFVTETISCHRPQVTHEVNYPQTRIPVKGTRYRCHEITRVRDGSSPHDPPAVLEPN